MAAAPAGAPVQYGGFWMRFLAVLIDGIVLGAVLGPVTAIIIGLGIAGSASINPDNPSPALIAIITAYLILIPIYFVAGWLYEAFTTSSSWQGTVGKKILGLKVTDEAGNRIGFGRATGRHFGKIISAMIFYIGFIMAGFTDRKRALHDMIAGTVVMKK
jgi:uncharacterized RDD family membrane protein YckC